MELPTFDYSVAVGEPAARTQSVSDMDRIGRIVNVLRDMRIAALVSAVDVQLRTVVRGRDGPEPEKLGATLRLRPPDACITDIVLA